MHVQMCVCVHDPGQISNSRKVDETDTLLPACLPVRPFVCLFVCLCVFLPPCVRVCDSIDVSHNMKCVTHIPCVFVRVYARACATHMQRDVLVLFFITGLNAVQDVCRRSPSCTLFSIFLYGLCTLKCALRRTLCARLQAAQRCAALASSESGSGQSTVACATDALQSLTTTVRGLETVWDTGIILSLSSSWARAR